MVLPPGPRDLWSQLDADKQKAGPTNQHLYLTDPFISQSAKLQLQQQQHQQALQEQQRARSATPTQEKADTPIQHGPSAYASRSGLTSYASEEEQKKKWDKLPMVHMNQDMRAEVEDVVKKQMAGELYQSVNVLAMFVLRLLMYAIHCTRKLTLCICIMSIVHRGVWCAWRTNVQYGPF